MLQLSKTRLNCRLLSLSLIALASSAIHLHAAMVVDSISGAVTQNEINSFKSFMSSEHPAITTNYWDWTFTGYMGPDLRALDLMYQITGDRAILDKAIEFADVAIKVSAGVAGGGPPSEGSADGIGHAAFCAKLILETPSIWNLTVSIGDPNGYGTTYKARALSYVRIGTQNMDKYITPVYVNASDKHFKGITTGLGWNRQTMIANGYHELANCHELLQDNPSKVNAYRQIVGVNIQWFLSRADFYTASGKPVVTWFYGVNNDGTDGHLEDVGHAGWDILGLTRCAQSGLYGITTAQMTAFANNVYYVMYNTTTKDFGGSVDGTGTRRQSLQPPWTELVRYLTSPDLYVVLYNTEHFSNNNNIATNPLQFATFMTEKDRRYLESQGTAGGMFEAENQTITASSGDSSTINSETPASNGQYVQYNSNAVGDFVRFRLPNIAPGTYTVTIGFKRQTSRAIMQTVVGAEGGALSNLGGTIDMYGASAFNSLAIGTWTIGTTGNKSVEFRVTGKNASSSNYIMAIDYIKLQ